MNTTNFQNNSSKLDTCQVRTVKYNGTRVGKAIDIILSAFPKLLEAEKEQIIDAHRNGQNDAYADGCTWYRTAEEYYQQTYNPEQ